MTRTISAIAKDIRSSWKNLNDNHPAFEYLELMMKIDKLEDNVLPRSLGDNREIVSRFLGVCGTFRSSDGSASRLKEELRAIMGYKPGSNHQ